MPNERPRGKVQYDNTDRIVIVTGGCSGIGLAICDRFCESGATVVCFDVDDSGIDRLPTGAHFEQVDTANETQCRDAVARTVEKFRAIDVLVNNAAIQPVAAYKPIHEIPTSVWEEMVGINLTGYTNMAKQVLPTMLVQKSGVIVNMASGQGHRTARQVGVYGPIKAANIMQSRQWGIEYARDGIRVVSVSPGAIETPLVLASLEAQGGRANLENRHPIGRIGTPDEVAHCVLWLASEHASFITATDLEVDGGLGAFGSFADPY